MPELPEAEVVARQVRAALAGATLTAVWIGRDDIIRAGLSSKPWYQGARLIAVERRGKSVVLAFSKEGAVRYLVAELGMTGLLLFAWADQAYAKHTHVRMLFHGGREPELRYWNPRRFGRVYLLDEQGLAAFTARRFGCDPMTVEWDQFWSLVHRRRGRLKALLMHQQLIAGIGNIYANEILFRARLHPYRMASRVRKEHVRRMYDEMRGVLSVATEAGGSSVRDFLAPDGKAGRYQLAHVVYNKAGQSCGHGCGTLIRALKGERTSFYCPRCQRVG